MFHPCIMIAIDVRRTLSKKRVLICKAADKTLCSFCSGISLCCLPLEAGDRLALYAGDDFPSHPTSDFFGGWGCITGQCFSPREALIVSPVWRSLKDIHSQKQTVNKQDVRLKIYQLHGFFCFSFDWKKLCQLVCTVSFSSKSLSPYHT